jgi:pimeloyl-ACP methyl ester carboxylesterase
MCVLAMAPVAWTQPRADPSFNSNGVPIHYADSGRGVPVVLLHGFTGSYARHWESPGVMKALETGGFRVIAMDSRGHGQSGRPRESSDYGFELVRDVIRLLDHLKIDRAHIVGFSMGGAIANQLLIKYPRRLRTVTLLGAGWEGDDVRPITSQMLTVADGLAARDASVLMRILTPADKPVPTGDEAATATADLFSRNDPQVLGAIARSLPTLYEVPGKDLRATKVPVLAIIGQYDNNLAAVNRMKGVMPRLEVIELPGADHRTSLRPSAEHILAFLNKHGRD